MPTVGSTPVFTPDEASARLRHAVHAKAENRLYDEARYGPNRLSALTFIARIVLMFAAGAIAETPNETEINHGWGRYQTR